MKKNKTTIILAEGSFEGKLNKPLRDICVSGEGINKMGVAAREPPHACNVEKRHVCNIEDPRRR